MANTMTYEPAPHALNPEMGWAKPRIRRTVDGDWECCVRGFLHHGQDVTVRGIHKELDWAWILMVDHLVRHEILPTYEATKGPSYVDGERND